MPGTMLVYDPKAKDDDERKARNAQIDHYWKLRDGEHKKPLKIKNNEDDNIILNVSGQVIDDIAEFLGVPELKVDGDETTPEGAESTAGTALKALQNNNEYASMCQDTIESGLIAGHVFMRIAEDGDGPMVAPLDPRYVSVFWDVTRPSLKRSLLWYRLTWAVENTTYRQDIVPDWLLPDDGGKPGSPRDNQRWWIIQYVKASNKIEFTEEGRDPWDFPFAPIVDWKSRRRPHQYYGWSELAANAERLQNGINFTASNTGRIIKFHAHPKTIVTGADIEKLQTGPDGLFSFPDPEVKIQNLEMQSDLSSSIKYLDMLEQRFFAERRVVDPAQIKDKVGALTNFGLQVMYLQMLKLLAEKQDFYGSGFAETFRRALLISGVDVKLKTEWVNPLPVNRLEVVNAASTEADIGTTSKKTLAGDLGRDYDKERDQMKDEKADAVDNAAAFAIRMGQQGNVFGSRQQPTNGNPLNAGQR